MVPLPDTSIDGKWPLIAPVVAGIEEMAQPQVELPHRGIDVRLAHRTGIQDGVAADLACRPSECVDERVVGAGRHHLDAFGGPFGERADVVECHFWDDDESI